MGSHFSSIGLSVETDDDLIEIAKRAVASAERIDTRLGSYLWFRDSQGQSGVELWVQLDRDQGLVGMNPHFDGGARTRLGLAASLQRPPLELDGAFLGTAGPDEANPGEGTHRVAFDCPNYRACDDVLLPSVATVQLAAFAHDMRLFDSVESYEHAVRHDDNPLASQAYVPSGLLHQGRGAPPSLALIAGHIRRVERRRNPLSGEPFYWLSVQSAAGVIDVVAAPDMVPTQPSFGGVVTGSFWVSGRLLSYERRRTSFIRRLLTPPLIRKVST